MKQYNFKLEPGPIIPENSGYVILAGLSRLFPFMHGQRHVQVAPVRGRRSYKHPNYVQLDGQSWLCIRGIDAAQAATMSGGVFDVRGESVTLRAPVEVELTPCSALVSRLVIFDGAVSPSLFLAALTAAAPPGSTIEVSRRRAFPIKGRMQIGYGVHLWGLTDEQSLFVQSRGIGRFTSMGCGVFGHATRLAVGGQG